MIYCIFVTEDKVHDSKMHNFVSVSSILLQDWRLTQSPPPSPDLPNYLKDKREGKFNYFWEYWEQKGYIKLPVLLKYLQV